MGFPKYMSASGYAKATGIGEAEVKKMIATGELKAHITEGGHYKIEVSQDAVPIEDYREVIEENARLKAVLTTIFETAKQVERRITNEKKYEI